MSKPIKLESDPIEKDYEDYICAFFQSGGLYVEKSIIHREAAEILELDIIISDFKKSSIERKLIEIKSGDWGFSEVFKVKGWLVYLGIEKGLFIVKKERDFFDYYKKKSEELGIELINNSDLNKTNDSLRKFLYQSVDNKEIETLRFSYLIERKLIKELKNLKKTSPDVQGYKKLDNYLFVINSGSFFVNDPLVSFLKKDIGKFDILKKEAIKVSKSKIGYIITLNSGRKIYCTKLVIAIGVIPKKINAKLINTIKKADITEKSFDSLLKIDFKKNDLVCIGSGDNILCKVLRLVNYLKQKSIPFNHEFIKIILKNKFNKDVDKKMLSEIKKLEMEGIVKVYKSYWKINSFSLTKNGLIKKIKGEKFTYDLKNKNGAYVLIFTGNIQNKIIFKNIKIDDLIKIGDFSTISNSRMLSVQLSILDAQKKALHFIKNNPFIYG